MSSNRKKRRKYVFCGGAPSNFFSLSLLLLFEAFTYRSSSRGEEDEGRRRRRQGGAVPPPASWGWWRERQRPLQGPRWKTLVHNLNCEKTSPQNFPEKKKRRRVTTKSTTNDSIGSETFVCLNCNSIRARTAASLYLLRSLSCALSLSRSLAAPLARSLISLFLPPKRQNEKKDWKDRIVSYRIILISHAQNIMREQTGCYLAPRWR